MQDQSARHASSSKRIHEPPNPIANPLIEEIPVAIARQKRCSCVHDGTSSQRRPPRVEHPQSDGATIAFARGISSDPEVAAFQAPHHQVVALRALQVVVALYEEAPAHGGGRGQTEDLGGEVVGCVVAGFDQEDGVACAGEVHGDGAWEDVISTGWDVADWHWGAHLHQGLSLSRCNRRFLYHFLLVRIPRLERTQTLRVQHGRTQRRADPPVGTSYCNCSTARATVQRYRRRKMHVLILACDHCKSYSYRGRARPKDAVRVYPDLHRLSRGVNFSTEVFNLDAYTD